MSFPYVPNGFAKFPVKFDMTLEGVHETFLKASEEIRVSRSLSLHFPLHQIPHPAFG
jgi:hypothetical protein